MAKVGEGDPRWIVSERKDGANVNAWHWAERDLSKHTHEQLKRALAKLPLTPAGDEKDSSASAAAVRDLVVDEVSEIAGDVTVAQRKGKMMCYFELKLTVKWSGRVAAAAADADDDTPPVVRGTMEVPEVDHDTFRDEYEIVVKCQDNDAAARSVEDVVRSRGRAAVRAAIARYFDELFAEYHIGQVLKPGTVMPPPPPASPTQPQQTQPQTTSTATSNDGNKTASSAAPTTTTTTTASSGEPSSFTWRMRWHAPIDDVFAALTDARRASVYTRAAATIDARAGGQFSFLGALITGYYVDVQPPCLIKSQWRLSGWPAGVHSSVVMQLTKEQPGVTILEFAQSGIPAGQLTSVQEGWRINFFNAIKMVFGYTLDYL